MKTGISEQQELLLLKACQNGGQFSIGLAEQLYSSKSTAKNAVTKLEVLGFIENTAPGYFKATKLTHDVKQELKAGDGSEGSDSVAETEDDAGSDFKIEAV